MLPLGEKYNFLSNLIIRPNRDSYSIEALGPKFIMLEKAKNFKVVHSLIRLKNNRGMVLHCSYYEPYIPPTKQIPCVVYLHGNSSSRVEAIPFLDYILPFNISLFCFDFSGSGKSEGDYVTLGYYERHDVKCVVDYLRGSGRVSTISLWGRSMGAATALMYASMDTSIKAIVADSPFSNLEDLAHELVRKYIDIPKVLFDFGFSFIQSSAEQKAKMKFEELDVTQHISSFNSIPIMFVYAEKDDFIHPDHCIKLHEAYKGPKILFSVEGSHNTSRPVVSLMKIVNFLVCQSLQMKRIGSEPHLLPGSPKGAILFEKKGVVFGKDAVLRAQEDQKRQNGKFLNGQSPQEKERKLPENEYFQAKAQTARKKNQDEIPKDK